MLLEFAAFFTQQHLFLFFFFLHNQKWETRSLRYHKIKQRRSLCQQDKWKNLFKVIILLFGWMCCSVCGIQIWAGAFSAVNLTGSAGWVWCCLHFPEKVKCTFLSVCVCQTQIYPEINQKAPYHLEKTETERWWKEHWVPGCKLSETLNAPTWARPGLLPFPLCHLPPIPAVTEAYELEL